MKIIKDQVEYEINPGYDWFWKMFQDGSWEPATFRIFDRFLKPDRAMLDIGAWIGPTALYGASRASQVYAFEPDPVAFAHLRENIAMNHHDNVVAYNVAVSEGWGYLDIGVKNGVGDSMTSVLWANGGKEGDKTFRVPTVSLDSLILEINPNFVKIDIEGGEADVLAASKFLKVRKPTIHLSLHTPWFEGQALEDYKRKIREALADYPHILNENLEKVQGVDAVFDSQKFNSIVAKYGELENG